MKKVNKNSPALRWVFGGQTAPSPAHCERSAQIICIVFMNITYLDFWLLLCYNMFSMKLSHGPCF